MTLLLALASRRAISGRLAKLRQKLIDAEYVVEERVENYEPGQESIIESGEATPVIEAVQDNGDHEGDQQGEGEDLGDTSEREDGSDTEVEAVESDDVELEAEVRVLG